MLKPSLYLKRPVRASEDFHGVENGVFNPFPHLKRPARVSENFHGGENDVYKPSRYINRPARDSEACTNFRKGPRWLKRRLQTFTVLK